MSAMFKMFRQSISAALCVVLALIALLPAAQAARETTYYHTDGLGSVVAASNQAGELLWRKDYAPFGDQIDQTPDTEKLGYTGKPHDALLGLTNLGARYYDPHLGRFMSPDPVGFVESNPMSFNRYAYVNNNPYKYVDPDGEFLNFAAKFVLDVGVNIAFNYVTTGQMDVGGALKESAVGIFNPAKTVAKAGKLALALSKVEKKAERIIRTCCFVAGTQVLTESGYKNIEDVQLGERLWAKNVETGEQAWKPVTHVFVEPGRGIYEIKLTDNTGFVQKVEATDDHPFWVLGQGWKTTLALLPGDRVETDDGASMSVLSVVNEGRADVTYNFTVADFHTYYVTERNVLVHNCNAKMPIVGGGASLDNLTPSEIKRIQNATNRTKQEITVVGSRAGGTADPTSDWDYVFHGKKSKQRHSAKSSVPRGTQGGEHNASNRETGIDIHSEPVRTNEPYITFQPK